MKKNETEEFMHTTDRCTKCGGSEISKKEAYTSKGVKVLIVYCKRCKTETRRRLAEEV